MGEREPQLSPDDILAIGARIASRVDEESYAALIADPDLRAAIVYDDLDMVDQVKYPPLDDTEDNAGEHSG